MPYIPSREAAKLLGPHPNTLRQYADEGKIKTIRTASGQRRYDADSYIRDSAGAVTVCYCRVSSHARRDDLQRQVAFMRELYPGAEVVTDVGGGLNFQRKGLLALLERLHRGDKLRLGLPTGTGWPGSDLTSSAGRLSETAGKSWFPAATITAPSRNSPRIFSPSCTPFPAGYLYGLRRYRNAIAQDKGLSVEAAADDAEGLV